MISGFGGLCGLGLYGSAQKAGRGGIQVMCVAARLAGLGFMAWWIKGFESLGEEGLTAVSRPNLGPSTRAALNLLKLSWLRVH